MQSPQTSSARASYADAPTQYLELPDRTLAYRRVGSGPPLVLCNRFRGILDTWDPAFIDGLSASNSVVTFDFSGLGLSSGNPPSSILGMASDVADLASGLGFERIVLGGWSLGGLVAQTAAARFPRLVQHLILIGTGPAGQNRHPMEPIFLERAHKPVNDLADEVVLFFEPASEASRRAAERSHARIAGRQRDLSVPVPPAAWKGLHAAGAEAQRDAHGARDFLQQTTIPILVISGDHDIVFPVENWFDLNRNWPTLQLVVFPRAGHGPQHAYIQQSVSAIQSFLQTT